MTKRLNQVAHNILVGFLLSLGIFPNDGEDITEVRDYGPHRVYTQMARVPDSVADTIDPAEALDKLVSYLEHHNALPGAERFEPYNVQAYM